MNDVGLCGVCGGESGGCYVGVASIPGVPMSIAWCDECLKRDSAPAFVFDHDYVFVAGGQLDNLADWARARVTWADGAYIPFDDYVKRITPEEVERQLKEFADACNQEGIIVDPEVAPPAPLDGIF